MKKSKFSEELRNRVTGARVALVELKRDGQRWTCGEIAARFNRPAPAWVAAFAETLASARA